MNPLLGAVLARAPFDVPVVIGREEAQRLARLELARQEYQKDDQTWVQKAIQWLLDRINDVLDRATTTSPLGWFGLLGIVVLVVLYIWGGEVIRNFNMAMLFGVLIGTYSSIFIATPVAAQLQERRPEMKALAARVAARRAGTDARGKSAAQRRKGGGATATAVLEDTEVDADEATAATGSAHPTAADLTSTVVQTGPRTQPKSGGSRSKRKKR